MTKKVRLLTAAAVGAFGLGLIATNSFASGPLMLGPVTAPVTAHTMHTSVATTPSFQKQVLSQYRQVRAFWLSRAIVR